MSSRSRRREYRDGVRFNEERRWRWSRAPRCPLCGPRGGHDRLRRHGRRRGRK